MSVITTLDVSNLTRSEYRTVLDAMGVEEKPAAGIYFHIAAETPEGMRIAELWDRKEGFEAFLDKRLGPATRAVGVERETRVVVQSLFNLFAPRLDDLPALPRRAGSVVTTLDVEGLTGKEFRAILDHMGVERDPEPGIFLHYTTPTSGGYRIVELWDARENFQRFLERRLAPATAALGIQRKTDITFHALCNVFLPRAGELVGLIPSLPGGPGASAPAASARPWR